MQKIATAESPFERDEPSWRERFQVRTSALTAVSIGLTTSEDVVGACSTARRMGAQLCFESPTIDALAAALAAAGGAVVGRGGRGSCLVADASEPDTVRLRVTIEARSVSVPNLETTLLQRAPQCSYRPALGLPRGPFHWDVRPSAAHTGANIALTLERPRPRRLADGSA